jgi:protein-disulfide isomerase
MPLRSNPIRAFALVAAAAVSLAGGPAAAQSEREVEAIVRKYLAEHPEDVQRIVKDYLAQHPEVVQDALNELMKRRQAADAGGKREAIKANAKLLFDSSRQVTLGNPNGDVTLVEFVDYNCGFCKRALADMLALMRDDPQLRIVLKEFPILGPGSTEAARIAVAVHMQDPSGTKYLAFHQKMLGSRSPANQASALAAAKDAGLDMTRLEADAANELVGATLAESTTLARALGISGTPAYVVGDAVVRGAVGLVALKEKLAAARNR